MLKPFIKLALLSALLSTQLSLPSFSMEIDDKQDERITICQACWKNPLRSNGKKREILNHDCTRVLRVCKKCHDEQLALDKEDKEEDERLKTIAYEQLEKLPKINFPGKNSKKK